MAVQGGTGATSGTLGIGFRGQRIDSTEEDQMNAHNASIDAPTAISNIAHGLET